MSYTGIAKVVGLSEAAVRSRVQRLIEGNVVQIVGRHRSPAARVPAPGDGRREDRGRHLDGRRYARLDPRSRLRRVLGGSFDLLFEIVCEDDEHLLTILNDKMRTIPGVRTTETYTYLRLHKQTYAWGTR